MTDLPTTSIGWSLCKSLTDGLGVALGGVDCHTGYPGEANETREMLWVDEFVSEVNVPVMSAGRHQRDDTITITFDVKVKDRATIDATHTRLAEIIAQVEDAFAHENDTDEELAGVIDWEVSGHRQTATQTPDGPQGYAEITAVVHTRLH